MHTHRSTSRLPWSPSPGMVSFGGQQGMRLRREMTLQELNQALQGLSFVFKDSHWFGLSSKPCGNQYG